MKSIVLITLLFSFSLFSAHNVVTKIEINYGSKDGILVKNPVTVRRSVEGLKEIDGDNDWQRVGERDQVSIR